MNTTTKIAAGTVGAAVVAASLWLLPADKAAVAPTVQTTADAIPWEEIPATSIGSTELAATKIDSTSIAAVDLELESVLSLVSEDIRADILAATPIDRVKILAGILGSQAILTLDMPVGEFSSVKAWKSELAALSPKERKEVVANLLRSESSVGRANRIASLLWVQEMQKDTPDEAVLAKYREVFKVKEASPPAAWYDDGLPVQPPFVTGTVLWDAKPDYNVSRLSFPVIDVDPDYGPYAHYDFAAWAQRIYNEQPSQVVIGWGNGLNNFEKPDTTKYAQYMREIRAVVRMVREVSPRTFIWVTACYGTPTYKPWMEQIGGLGDGIALWNVAYFGAVPQFPMTQRKVRADAHGKPVMLLGFFGYKCFETTARKPPDFAQRMAAAEQAARDAGFSGFIRVEAK